MAHRAAACPDMLERNYVLVICSNDSGQVEDQHTHHDAILCLGWTGCVCLSISWSVHHFDCVHITSLNGPNLIFFFHESIDKPNLIFFFLHIRSCPLACSIRLEFSCFFYISRLSSFSLKINLSSSCSHSHPYRLYCLSTSTGHEYTVIHVYDLTLLLFLYACGSNFS